MQPAVLRALECDRIRDLLAFQTLTPPGWAVAPAPDTEGGNGATTMEFKD